MQTYFPHINIKARLLQREGERESKQQLRKRGAVIKCRSALPPDPKSFFSTAQRRQACKQWIYATACN